MQKPKKIKRNTVPMSVNSILMFSFSALLFLVIIIMGIVQGLIMQSSLTEQTYGKQIGQSREIYVSLNEMSNDPTALRNLKINNYILRQSRESQNAVYIIDGEGKVLYPYFEEADETSSTEQTDFSGEMEDIHGAFGGADSAAGKIVSYQKDKVCYTATSMTLAGERVYLFMFASSRLSSKTILSMVVRLGIVSIGVFLAEFLVIGIVSSKISDPLAKISKNARLLGTGNFNVDFETEEGICKEINELSKSLAETRDEISKSDKMQKELIANVSHDFKTPLTMIKAYASMIQEISGDNPEKRNKHCQVIIDEAERLASLVNDLLDISKISSGMAALKTAVFNLSDYTVEIVDRFRYLEETQGYKIYTDITPDLYTEADKDKIGQVLYNLIGNAVNYTGEDKSIRIRLMRDRDRILFDVSDTGAGIGKEEINTIWDRYYRSADTHKRPVKGTGLGLSIVKTILTRHQFDFGVVSELGKGSRFYVKFPERTVWNLNTDDED